MEIADFFQFDGNFAKEKDGVLTKVDTKVRKSFPVNEINTVHMNEAEKKRGQRTDAKLYNILNGCYGKGEVIVSLASTASGGYAEVYNTISGNTQVAYIKEVNGTTAKGLAVSACEYSPNGTSQPYSTGHKGTVLLAAFLALRLAKDTELSSSVNEYRDLVVEDPDSYLWDDATICSRVGKIFGEVTANLYYTMKHDYYLPSKINVLRQADIETIGSTITKVMMGEVKKATVKKTTKEGKKGLYDLNPSRKLTKEEEALVPVMPSSYKWEDWMFTLAQEIRDSQEFSEPTNVILLYGDSGSGKSQAVSAIASLLNRPRLIWTADPDADEFKLIGSTMPNTKKKGNKSDISSLCKAQGIPTFEDVVFDFETAYQKLFGKKPDAYADPVDCYKEIHKRVERSADSDFVFVESQIIEAIRKGYLVEVQEISIIKRQSVVVALNSLLDYTNSLTLPTGETIQRHKEAVVFMTSNMNYEGCRALQQSVLSRINEIREITTPDADVLFQRAKANTGFKDKAALKKMSKLVYEINEYSKNEDISDGVCGLRELQNWCKKAMLFQKRRNDQWDDIENEVLCGSAFATIINHCSQNDEDRERIITACIGKVFNPNEIAAGRNYYQAGLV